MTKPKLFNNPFGAVKLAKDEPALGPASKSGRAAPPRHALEKPPEKRSPPSEAEERRLFLESMGEVAPVHQRAERISSKASSALPHLPSEDDDVLAELSELVAGETPFDLSSSDAPMEGSLVRLDRRILEQLRAGDYAIQGQLDLHGLTRTEAKAALEKFVVAAHHAGKCCMLVVHGRGLPTSRASSCSAVTALVAP